MREPPENAATWSVVSIRRQTDRIRHIRSVIDASDGSRRVFFSSSLRSHSSEPCAAAQAGWAAPSGPWTPAMRPNG